MDHQALSAVVEASGHRFVFLGGHVTLDFVNTVMVEGGELVDRVASPQELAAWVAASSLGPDYGEPTEIDPTVYAQAIGLRSALKAAFDALVAAQPVPDAPLRTINAILGKAPGSALHRCAGGGLRHDLRIDLRNDAAPLPWLLADAAATLLAGPRIPLLRRCANTGRCVLLFLDTSRSHTRRWCSMELCGNRRKVAAHSARTRRRRTGSVG